MLRTSLKSLWAHRIRLAMGTIAIVLSIAFVSGSFIFANLLLTTADQLLSSRSADVNVYLDQERTGSSDSPMISQGLSSKLADEVRAIVEVTRVEPLVSSTEVYALDHTQRLLNFDQSVSIAVNWQDAPSVGSGSGPAVVNGRSPENAGEVALDPSTLARSGHQIGDDIQITTPYDGVQSYRIVGTAIYGTSGAGSATYLFFTLADIQQIVLRGQDFYTGLWVVTDQDANAGDVASAIEGLLPTGYVAKTGEAAMTEARESLDLSVDFVSVFFLVIAGSAVVLASAFMVNTAVIVLARRASELALLRALGATRRQVLGSLLVEAVVIGTLGSTAGIILGYVLVWAILATLGALSADPGVLVPQLTGLSVGTSYALGIGLTSLAAWLLGRRASVARPVETMADLKTDLANLGKTPVVGIALLEFGVAVIVCAVWIPVPQPLLWFSAGAVLLIAGTALFTTVLGGTLIEGLDALLIRVFGDLGRMASRNCLRQPHRTVAAATTIMVGLALVTAMSIVADSSTTSIREQLTANQRGDFIIKSIAGQPFDAAVVDEAAAVSGVSSAYGFSRAITTVGGKLVALTGASAQALTEAVTLDITGSLNADAPLAPVLISTGLAAENKLVPGNLLRLSTPTGQGLDLHIAGVYPNSQASAFGDVIVTPGTFTQLTSVNSVRRVVVFAEDNADLSTVRSGLDALVKDKATVTVIDMGEYAKARVDRFSQISILLYSLLALAMAISLLGIVNTLSLSNTQRSDEFGLLRAMGMTRQQLQSMMCLETVIIAVIGTLLGVALGLVCGAGLVHLLADQGITQLRVPWALLSAFSAVAGVLAVLATLGLARHALSRDVLEAVTSG